jgi:hypothetical protein
MSRLIDGEDRVRCVLEETTMPVAHPATVANDCLLNHMFRMYPRCQNGQTGRATSSRAASGSVRTV